MSGKDVSIAKLYLKMLLNMILLDKKIKVKAEVEHPI